MSCKTAKDKSKCETIMANWAIIKQKNPLHYSKSTFLQGDNMFDRIL